MRINKIEIFYYLSMFICLFVYLFIVITLLIMSSNNFNQCNKCDILYKTSTCPMCKITNDNTGKPINYLNPMFYLYCYVPSYDNNPNLNKFDYSDVYLVFLFIVYIIHHSESYCAWLFSLSLIAISLYDFFCLTILKNILLSSSDHFLL